MRKPFFIFCSIIFSLFLLGSAATVLAQGGVGPQGNLDTAIQGFASLSPDDKQSVLSTMGVPAMGKFSWPGIIGGFLFGSIGFVAFVYGKKSSLFKPTILGIALMAYPYFFPNTMAVYGIGIVLTAALYFFRE